MLAVQRGSLYDDGDVLVDQKVNGLNSFADEEQMSEIMADQCAESMESVLVYTGVHSKPESIAEALDGSDREPNILVDHGHRDFDFDSDLLQPSMEAHNILDAIRKIFKREGFK